MPYAARVAAAMLVLAALAFGALCLSQLWRDNAAPDIDPRAYPAAREGRYALAVDRCDRTAKKLTVQGWLVLPGQPREARRLRVAVAQNGRWRALDTRLHDRDDVAGRAAADTSVAGYYRHSGFEASVDLARAGIVGPIEAVAVAHDSSAGAALVALPCPGLVP